MTTNPLRIGSLYRIKDRSLINFYNDRGAVIRIDEHEPILYLGYKINPYITIHKFLYGETTVHWNRSLGFEDFALRDWLIKV